MPVSNQSAPFKKEPFYQRQGFLREPDWRWQEAKNINMAEALQLDRPQPSDIIVAFAARIQKASRDPASRQFIQLKMPDVWQVIKLGNMDNSSQLRCQIQSCLINDLTPQQTSQKLKWCSQVQVKLYRDLFLDLSGIQGLAGWFQQMLLQPALNGQSSNLFRCRALAHYHSLQAALHSLRFGNAGHSAKQAMVNMWSSQKGKRIFDYMARNLNVPVQIYVPTMQSIIKNVQDRQFARQMKGQSTQTSVAQQASKVIQQGIRGFTQSQIADVSNAQDSSNQYIKVILNKEQKA